MEISLSQYSLSALRCSHHISMRLEFVVLQSSLGSERSLSSCSWCSLREYHTDFSEDTLLTAGEVVIGMSTRKRTWNNRLPTPFQQRSRETRSGHATRACEPRISGVRLTFLVTSTADRSPQSDSLCDYHSFIVIVYIINTPLIIFKLPKTSYWLVSTRGVG